MRAVTLAALAVRGILRNKMRTALTVLAAVFALVAFVLLRTIVDAYYVFADQASEDRLSTRHKVSAAVPLPMRYVDAVRGLPGVRAATFATLVGSKATNHPDTFIPALAVEPASFLEVFDEVVVTAEAKAAWLEDRQGALVAEALARKLGLSVGERVTLVGTRINGEWQLTVRGIYSTARQASSGSELLFHWAHLNETLSPRERDHVRWVFSRVRGATEAVGVGEAIDRMFEQKDVPTLTMSEKAVQLAALAGVSSILTSVDVASIVILAISMLVLGNTIAMGVRERVTEYATLRALGFASRHLAFLILGEALTFGFVAGALGVALSYPVVELGMGRWLEQNMGNLVPYFRVDPMTLVATLLIAILVGLLAAGIPAIQAIRSPVIQGLRRTG